MDNHKGVWKNQAQQWTRVGPPLRPCAEDHELLEQVVHTWSANYSAPRVLVLGVTPEMALLNWPEKTKLLAVDRSQEMIDRVWPGYPNPGEGVLCANWLNLPLDEYSKDIVVSDGPFGVLRYPHEYKKLLSSLNTILQPKGLFAFRIFVRPEEPETPNDIYRDALDGKIGSFHVFKLRLLMAMQPTSDAGVCTGDVWNEWKENGPDISVLSKRCGWPVDQIKTIEAYRGQKDIYSFPTLSEIRKIFDEANFEEVEYATKNYELGERCPTLVYQPKASS